MDDPAMEPLYKLLSQSRHTVVTAEIGSALLDCYFSYSGPMFFIVTRSIFLRDMAFGGPFFSDFLLVALYAAGTRTIDGLSEDERKSQGDHFTHLGRDMLSKELSGPTTIPLIQGLLLMSTRECVVGNISQGWSHSGLVRCREYCFAESLCRLFV